VPGSSRPQSEARVAGCEVPCTQGYDPPRVGDFGTLAFGPLWGEGWEGSRTAKGFVVSRAGDFGTPREGGVVSRGVEDCEGPRAGDS